MVDSAPATPLADLAARAYVYGFPLVFDLDQVDRYVTTGIGANAAAPLNTFSHARTLAGPEDRFVTINNDTVYSMAQLDLSGGPLELDVPDVGERYYVLQFVSAWTDNFAYVGTRGTGNRAGRFLLVPPGWDGAAPSDRTVIHVPTAIASIVGRWAVDGEDDLPAVHALQDATRLAPAPGNATLTGLPNAATAGLDDRLAFWERYRVASQALPPAARDAVLQAGFGPLGLTGETPVGALSDVQQDALRAGHDEGRATIEAGLRGGFAEEVNGWQLAHHSFDYNLDHFEVGAIDDARFKADDGPKRFVVRAAAALGGLWGNHAYEAAYALVYVDADGAPLNGEHEYRLRLSPTPPNHGFWSVTMYDVPDYYLVANPANRYSLGDRTPGLVADDDGGLTIHIGHAEPRDPARRANWLPAPAGPFRPVLRIYVPDERVLDGRYVLPAIERIS